jgi:hypothetical protein
MAETIYLTNVRMSFPKLVEAAAMKDYPAAGKKWGADLILDPNDPNFTKFMSEVGKMAAEKWGANADTVLQMVQSDKRNRCFGNGAEKVNKKFEPYVGYPGMVYISASANEDRPPQIVRPSDGVAIDNLNTLERTAAARKLYGGCYVNAAVRPWAQDNQFGRAIRCELIAIQFLRDGDSFGEGSADVSGMFGAVPEAAAPAFPPLSMLSFFGAPQQ